MTPRDFVPISTATLRGDKKISFDVYIRVAGKFILYCRQGDSFEGTRLTRLKEKQVKELFVLNEQEANYKKYLDENIEQAYSNTLGRPLEIRVQIIQGYNQSLAEGFMSGLNRETYEECRRSCKRLVPFFLEDQRALPLLLSLKNEEQDLAHHGVAVAGLATYLAEQTGLNDGQPVDLMALGCFIHDIGLIDSSVDFKKPLKDLTPEELTLYKRHPKAGAKQLQEHHFLDPLVQNIILQHEEHIDGTGFPRGLVADEMDRLIPIVGLANSFDRLVAFEKLSPKDALQRLLIDKMGAYSLEHLQILQNLLKSTGYVS